MNRCKFEVYREGVIWKAALVASNGKIMMILDNRYGRKQAALDGIKVVSALIKQEPQVTFR